MELPPNGPYQPGKEPRPEEIAQGGEILPENVTDIFKYENRRRTQLAIDGVDRSISRHPARGKKTVQETIEDSKKNRPHNIDS